MPDGNASPLSDLINMIQGLELSPNSATDVATLRTRLLNDLIALGLSGGLSSIAADTILSNITALPAIPIGNTLSDIIDALAGSDQGSILTRTAAGWTVLTPGTSGFILTSGGPAADLSWSAAP